MPTHATHDGRDVQHPDWTRIVQQQVVYAVMTRLNFRCKRFLITRWQMIWLYRLPDSLAGALYGGAVRQLGYRVVVTCQLGRGGGVGGGAVAG